MFALDWIVRNQLYFLATISIVAIIPVILLTIAGKIERIRSQSLRDEFGLHVAFSLQAPSLRATAFRVIVWAFALLGALGALGGVAYLISGNRPIPPTFGLEFPTAEYGKQLNSAAVTPSNTIPHTTETMIVFIHGWNGDSKETWLRFPNLMKRDKRFSSFAFYTVPYTTYMVRRNLTLVELAAWLEAGIRMKEDQFRAENLVIIAHSMGGLIAREISLLRAVDTSSITPLVLVEVGTPHLGANPAYLASKLGIAKEFTLAMKKDSSYLKGLRVRWSRAKPRPVTHCFSSPHDKVVSQSSALDQCDHIISYPKWNHQELVKPVDFEDPRYQMPATAIATEF